MSSPFGVVLTLIGTAIGLVLASELGFFLGRRQKAEVEAESRGQIAMVEGALLGLLGLLLGFTFSMAAGRFELRQNLVVQEASALGTVYLRCDFLPMVTLEDAQKKLREYADLRLLATRPEADEASLAESMRKVDRLQTDLWRIAMDEGRPRPGANSAALVGALNQLFDLGEARLAAYKNTVPLGVWVVLYLVAVLTVGSLGYGAGLSGRRMVLPITLVPLLMAVILTLLVDLGHPRHGLIRVSQDSMVRARELMK